ncbi:hypothetical protein T07_5843 [Trichinella nelsoni]|uniref:Uncharacterized protein n=1 Tax=Trichinella nelsoni TaxID=6336 RepID=A0A0V0SJ50_9BILA|nr:hypothetical protein T07_5843 [Trichinella nelsoni]
MSAEDGEEILRRVIAPLLQTAISPTLGITDLNDPPEYSLYCYRIIRCTPSDRIPYKAAVIVNAVHDEYFLFVGTYIRN